MKTTTKDMKFKAYDKVTDSWLYSEQFPSMWQYFKELENRGIRNSESLEYIGYSDSNEVDIYQGDIVRKNNGSIGYGNPMLIVWENAGFTVSPNRNSQFHKEMVIQLFHETFEVIGNSHQTPELLES